MCVVAVAYLAVGMICAAPAHATFPGKNGKIAFSDCGPTDCGVFTMNPDGSARMQVTHNTYSETFCTRLGCFVYQGRDQWPHWSPDGRKLVFSRDSAYAVELYTANADGSEVAPITDATPEIESEPAWSPDGRRIVFTSFGNVAGARDQIVVVNADGSRPALVADPGVAPDWSPDGGTIAYAAPRPPGSQFDFELHLVSPDGSNDRQITSSPAGVRLGNRSPSWSPDGKRIAFAFAECCTWDPHIAVVNADGSGRTLLTPDSTDDDDREPAFSPDGTKIVYEHQPPYLTERELVVINADGSGPVVLGSGMQPDWQPLIGPPRSEFKNASKFCKAERSFLGTAEFARKYRAGADAHGRCVTSHP